MNLFAFLGAIETGLVYSLVAIGIYLSFRILDFPDLTVDGSFPLGAIVAVVAIQAGVDPYISLLIALVAGALSGLITAFLNLYLKILALLAGILTMTALYSINLRIAGGSPNISLLMSPSIINVIPIEQINSFLNNVVITTKYLKPLLAAIIVIIFAIIIIYFLNCQYGLAMRATGANMKMARANGINTSQNIYVGMAISNALVALGGAIFAQMNGYADVTLGVGTIVEGLAAVIIGETIFRPRVMLKAIIACIIGSILYRLAVAFAIGFDFNIFGFKLGDNIAIEASDLKLITAVLVVIALTLPQIRQNLKARKGK